ncbi:MAG: hypothetical protein ACNI27_13790 [Desulfovibrio sp.]
MSRHKKPLVSKGNVFLLLFLVLGGCGYLYYSAQGLPDVTVKDLSNGLAKPLLRSLAFISAGLFVGQLIESLGWTRRLGKLAWPLIRRIGLPQEAGAAFTAAWVSGITANTLLFTAWREGRITRRELFLSNLLNATLPAFFLHLPSTFFIVYGFMGNAGLVYYLLTFAASLLRFSGVCLCCRVLLTARSIEGEYAGEKVKLKWQEALGGTYKRFKRRLLRLVVVMLPIYLLVFILTRYHFFASLNEFLAHSFVGTVIPVESMGVVIFSVMAEFTSGFAAAGALIDSGGLDIRYAVAALLLGNIIATPVRALRHQLPHYMGIFTPALGTALLITGQCVRVLSVIVILGLYLSFF